MGLSVVTLALARKNAKKQADIAVAKAVAAANAYTDQKISQIISFTIEIVDELPPLSEADPHVIYFVAKEDPSGEADSYNEYIKIDNKWELIGTTELDLSNYWTIEQVKEYVQSKEYTLPVATANILGGVKINGDSIQIDNNGVISVKEDYINNIVDNNFNDITENQISDLFN